LLNHRVFGTLAAAAVICASGAAYAHTTSIGYTPGAGEGSVIIWSGHYNHSGFPPPLEGIAYLTGVSLVYDSSAAYTIGPVDTKPTGLVDGTNNFFWGPDPYPFPLNDDPNLFGGVVHWQGVQFSGLLPGTYDFGCGTTCGDSDEWASLTQVGGAAGTVRFTLRAGDINLPPNGGIPEPSSWALLILGFGSAGAMIRRRKSALA
jgi:hypothetical protein